jgi:hypothetical protein
VKGPGERQWRFTLPRELRQPPTLVLRWSGLAYEGLLMDGSGAPVARARVFATPIGGGAMQSSVTDGGGAFRVDGLEPRRHILAFHVDSGSTLPEAGENPLGMARFDTSEPPSSVPVTLELRVPRFLAGAFVGRVQVELTGRLLDAGGAPVASAVVSVESLVDQRGGQLRLSPANGWKYSGADGRFSLNVARGDGYRSSVARETGQPMQREEWTALPRDGRVERDLVVR